MQCICYEDFLYIQLEFIWYTWYMHGICIAYTQNIHVLYIAYAMYMSSKFSAYTVKIYLIYMVYAWYMYSRYTSIYFLYDNINLPGPFTFTCRSILIEQSRSPCLQLSANLLRVSDGEHLVSILQLIPGTLAACALRRGTHSDRGHLITVHG